MKVVINDCKILKSKRENLEIVNFLVVSSCIYAGSDIIGYR